MKLDDFITRLAANRRHLARLWPTVRETYPQLQEPTRTRAQTDWNALVFVQRRIELQVVLGVRDRPGVRVIEQPESPPLGVFAGLPGDPGMGAAGVPAADDPRFAIPRINVEMPLVGGASLGWFQIPAGVAVGYWILLGLGVLLLILKVTGALGLVERHWAHTAALDSQVRNYQAQVAAQASMYRTQVADARARGLPPPPLPQQPSPPRPPKPPSDWSDMLLPIAAIAAAVVVVPKLVAKGA